MIRTKFLRLLSTVVLISIYEGARVIAGAGKTIVRRRTALKRRLLLVGTFDNQNWFRAHVQPIVQSGNVDVALVCDAPIEGVDGVKFYCPPRWAARIMTRAVAKFIWSLIASAQFRPTLCMGYHIFPAGVISLVAARLSGCMAGFQVTSGPLELEGGGWHAENRLLTGLGAPSELVEKSVLRMTQHFDLIVVRGERARDYVLNTGFRGHLACITGSVSVPSTLLPYDDRPTDIAFVGRLTEYKRPDRFITVLGALAQLRPAFKVVIIGDGPDEADLRQQAKDLGIDKNVQWLGKSNSVTSELKKSKVFVLTSRWEGVSIAMLEAMAHGCVPVVPDVGDLSDFVRHDRTGFIHPEDAVKSFAQSIDQILHDKLHWQSLSSAAHREIRHRASKSAVTKLWTNAIDAIHAPQPDAGV